MIKSVVFDLGGVLFTNGTKKFVKEISEQYNLDPKSVMEIMDGEIGSAYRESRITKEEFWRQAIEAMHIEADPEELNTRWINGYELIDGTRDIVLSLKGSYKVYYLSDNVPERVERINDKYNFISWFDGGIFSYEVDVRKPSRKMYELILNKANTIPSECIFIDDKESALSPAKEMGIQTILFTTPENLRSELSKLDILF